MINVICARLYHPHMVPTWYIHSTYMVHTWHIHGTYIAHTWYIHGTYMAHKWHIHGTYMAHTWHIHGTYMVHTWHIHDTYMIHTIMALYGNLHCYLMIMSTTPVHNNYDADIRELIVNIICDMAINVAIYR